MAVRQLNEHKMAVRQLLWSFFFSFLLIMVPRGLVGYRLRGSVLTFSELRL